MGASTFLKFASNTQKLNFQMLMLLKVLTETMFTTIKKQ